MDCEQLDRLAFANMKALHMIVTVGSTKGGVGKSTIALQMALARTLARKSVLLVDGDRQGSVLTAVSIRSDSSRSPGLACVHYPDERVLRAQVLQQAPHYDDVIIDVGGRDSATLRTALLITDVLVVPLPPRSIDVWALSDISELITGAQEARVERGRPAFVALAVLNMADPGTSSDNGEAFASLTEYPALIAIDAAMRRRKAYANASGQGLAVGELSPRDSKACDEIAALTRNVFKFAGNSNRKSKELV